MTARITTPPGIYSPEGFLGRRFGVELSDCQDPIYLTYKPGYFFRADVSQQATPVGRGGRHAVVSRYV